MTGLQILLAALIVLFVSEHFAAVCSGDDLEDNLPSQLDKWREVERELREDAKLARDRKIRLNIGSVMRDRGFGFKHPVVIVPGMMSSGLEVTDAGEHLLECSRRYLNRRIFGNVNNIKMLLFDKKCWSELMMLNVTTGLDPFGVKLRASDAPPNSDYIFPNNWIFHPLYASLNALGYNSSAIHYASYDWRLDQSKLEERDGFFSRLKSRIESMNAQFGSKVVVLSHSMGSLHFFYFIKWIENSSLSGGTQWLDANVANWVSVSCPFLGSPVSSSILFSGQMEEKPTQNVFIRLMANILLNSKELKTMARSLSSVPLLLPRGGNSIWGNKCGESMDAPAASINPVSDFLSIRLFDGTIMNLTLSESLEQLRHAGGPRIADVLTNVIDYRFLQTASELSWSSKSNKSWTSALTTTFPAVREMKVFAFYGVNNPTERKAFLRQVQQPAFLLTDPNREKFQFTRSSSGRSRYNASSWASFLPFWRLPTQRYVEDGFEVDTTVNSPEDGIESGFINGDGDNVVPLLSLGFVPRHVWGSKGPHNPADVPVVTREYYSGEHYRDGDDSGPSSSTHSGILQNYEFLLDFVRIVSGQQETCVYGANSEVPTFYPRAPLTPPINSEYSVLDSTLTAGYCLSNRVYSNVDKFKPVSETC